MLARDLLLGDGTLDYKLVAYSHNFRGECKDVTTIGRPADIKKRRLMLSTQDKRMELILAGMEQENAEFEENQRFELGDDFQGVITDYIYELQNDIAINND